MYYISFRMLSVFLNAFSVPFKKAHSNCKDNKKMR